jgi:hypothetical protein
MRKYEEAMKPSNTSIEMYIKLQVIIEAYIGLNTVQHIIYLYKIECMYVGSWGLAHPMSLTELALLDGRRPLPLGDVIGLTLNFKLHVCMHVPA